MRTLVEHYETLTVLRDALRCRACGICINANMDGTCDVDSRHDCALFERLPQVVETVSRVHSANIEDYTTALQESVCAQCFHQRLDGFCELRKANHCALFRYLAPILAVIERQS